MNKILIMISVLLCAGCSAHLVSDFEQQLLDTKVQQAYKRGDMRAAEARLRTKIKQQGGDAGDWLLLGKVLMRMGDYSAAQQAYLRVTERDPDNTSAWYQLSMSHLRLATEALIEVDKKRETEEALPLLVWLLELQTGKLATEKPLR